MDYPIRTIAVTWNPETTSRADLWGRIKLHYQEDLDRIHAAAILERQLVRRRAAPHYARNQAMLEAARQGVSVADLARRLGLRSIRVREIIRAETYWHGLQDPVAGGGQGRVIRVRSTSRFRDPPPTPSGMAQTSIVMTDP